MSAKMDANHNAAQPKENTMQALYALLIVPAVSLVIAMAINLNVINPWKRV